MKKKGFTLVELLAVIAILAILVLLALPQVLKMYKEARKSTFVQEAQRTYNMAQTDYVRDSIAENKNSITYSNCTGSTKQLNISTSKSFHYTITITGENVTAFKVSNGSFKYEGTTSVKASDISADTITEADDADICSGS